MSKFNRTVFATVVVAAICLLLLLISRDPYSYGHMGGEYRVFDEHANIVAMHRWQVWLTATMVALLVVAGIQHIRGAYTRAFTFLALEFVLFLGANLVYILRDGWELRRTMGDEGSMLPGAVTIVGFAVRILLVSMTRWGRN